MLLLRKILLLSIVFLILFKPAEAGKIKKRKVKRLFKHSLVLNDHFTGFELYDLDNQKSIFELNNDKYFTPASNTKLFTFYTCLKILGDSIPALKYKLKNDTLYFWPTGDPSFLHPDLKGINGFNLLKQTDKPLVYCTANYQNERYGAGWAWDDYAYYYQAEINDMPLYGNQVEFSPNGLNGLQVKPTYFKQMLVADSSSHATRFSVRRNFLTNKFIYPATIAISPKYLQDVPWQTSDDLTLALLQDTLKKRINCAAIPVAADAKVIYNTSADTVYRHMLQPSDNFIAEQLLLACSSVKFGYLNTDSVINYAVKNLLTDLPDKPEWHDGSGLSRLNLFTPRDIIALLIKISAEVKNDDYLHSLMPAGGVTRTLKSAYKTDNGKAFVWAKTGSLGNTYNQSGYLVTRKGKHLAYSFMNNNFTNATRSVRDEMANIITYIHDNY